METVNKFIIVIVMALLTFNSANAQSKKELKAEAKRQEQLNSTTDESGGRYFKMDKNLPHISIKIRDCYISDNSVTISFLISNSDSEDDSLNLIGDYCSWRDINNNYICCNNMGFATGNSNDFKENRYGVLIPGGGMLKMTMTIDKVNANTTIINNLNLAIQSKIMGERKKYTSTDGKSISHTYFNNVYYLNVNR